MLLRYHRFRCFQSPCSIVPSPSLAICTAAPRLQQTVRWCCGLFNYAASLCPNSQIAKWHESDCQRCETITAKNSDSRRSMDESDGFDPAVRDSMLSFLVEHQQQLRRP